MFMSKTNPKAAVSLITRIFAPIIRLLSRRKTAVSDDTLTAATSSDLDNVSGSGVGNIDIPPSYYHSPDYIELVHQLGNMLEMAQSLSTAALSLFTEGIDKLRQLENILQSANKSMEKLSDPGKVKISDFVDEMRRHMKYRVCKGLEQYDDYYCSGAGNIDNIDETNFLRRRGVGLKTYQEFLSLREEYYKKFKKRTK
jgi:exonuclease VII small subunit